MTLFEFVSVMFSIILGLSLSHHLAGVARLVRDTKEVSTFAPQTIWAITLFLMHFLLWWSIWDFRDVDWNYPRFVVASSEPLLLFFMTSLILPSPAGTASVDMRDHFLQIRTWLMALYAVIIVVFVFDGPVVYGVEPLLGIYRIPQALALTAVLSGLLTRKARHHVVIALVVLGVILFGSVLRFLPAAFSSGG